MASERADSQLLSKSIKVLKPSHRSTLLLMEGLNQLEPPSPSKIVQSVYLRDSEVINLRATPLPGQQPRDVLNGFSISPASGLKEGVFPPKKHQDLIFRFGPSGLAVASPSPASSFPKAA